MQNIHSSWNAICVHFSYNSLSKDKDYVKNDNGYVMNDNGYVTNYKDFVKRDFRPGVPGNTTH